MLTANQPNPNQWWIDQLSIEMTSGESQPDQPHPPLDHQALSTVCSCLHRFPLPPSSNPPLRARQADHLTTNATATGPSPSNIKPGWNVALTTQTHGKEGECGSSKWREGERRERREQLVSFRWGTRLAETEREGGRGESRNYKNHLQCEWKSQWERLRLFWRLHPLPPFTL